MTTTQIEILNFIHNYPDPSNDFMLSNALYDNFQEHDPAIIYSCETDHFYCLIDGTAYDKDGIARDAASTSQIYYYPICERE